VFAAVVFILLMIALMLSGGAAIHLGVFKAHHPDTGFGQKVVGGIVSYGLSAAAWLLMYSYFYLGW
jgi:hypothetical protein